MNTWAVIAVGAAVLILAVAALAFRTRRRAGARASGIDSLPALGGALVVLGIIFGASDRVIGYAFLGAGVAAGLIPAIVRFLGRR